MGNKSFYESFFDKYEKIILIMNYQLEIIWSKNLDDIENIFKDTILDNIHSYKEKDICNLKSGCYCIPLSEYTNIKYELINSPQTEGGTLTFIVDKDDIFYETFSNIKLKEYIETLNYNLNEHIFLISLAMDSIYNTLQENDLYNEIDDVNTVMKNCHRILKYTYNSSEFLIYKSQKFDIKTVDLSLVLREIIDNCKNILRIHQSSISELIEKNLFIKVDNERLNYFLITIFSMIYSPYNKFDIWAVKTDDSIELCLTSTSLGDNVSPQNNKFRKTIFSDGSYLVKRFCKAFNVVFFHNNFSDKNTIKLIFKYDDSEKHNLFLYNSPSIISNRFSKQHILLSDVMDFKYF